MNWLLPIEEIRITNEELALAKAALEKLNSDLEKRVAKRTREVILAQQEAERQRQRLHELFMESPAPIVILDGPDHTYELINAAYQQIFPGRSLLGKALLEALPEIAGTPIEDILRQVYQTGETFIAQEMLLMLARREGGPLEEIYWTFTYQARRNGEGVVDGIMVFAYEVTNQVKARKIVEENEQKARRLADELATANEELRVSNQRLIHINVDMDNFIYTASHDLKAPISNIEGFLTVLKRQLPADSVQNERIQQALSLIAASIGRFKKTIKDLSNITQLQKESNQAMTQVPLADIIEDVRLDLENLIQETEARLELDLDACPDIRFLEKNLRSIVYNLLSNALKYRSPTRKPLVYISCESTPDYKVLTVADNGLGIDLAKKEKVFAMFGRLHTHVEGSGVGLYMVKKMLENAGGSIEVESRLGQGSTFRAYFPT